jgi:hypothetical protein
MRGNGLPDFPDPGPGPSGNGAGFDLGGRYDSDPSPYHGADQACRSLLPQAAVRERAAAGRALAACMHSAGYQYFPDPDAQGVFNFGGINGSAPQFNAAIETCRSATGYPQGPLPLGS